MSENNARSYCYIDHANKKSEINSANPYLSWLNQNRRQRAKLEVKDEVAACSDEERSAVER